MKASRRLRRQLWKEVPNAKRLALLLSKHGFRTRKCLTERDLLNVVHNNFRVEATDCGTAIERIGLLPRDQLPKPPPKVKRWRSQDYDADHFKIEAQVPAVPFYETDEWRRVRYRALKSHGALCQCCGAGPSRGRPLHVDHIKPRSRFPELELELSNLQVLCVDCNKGKGAWDQTDWRKPNYGGVMSRKPGGKCPHARIQHCPLYVGMHMAGGPSCWPKNNELENGCAVDQGASYEDLVAAFFRAHPADFAEITMSEREYEAFEQRTRNIRVAGLH